MSVKWRVTLFFTGMMLLLAAFILVVIFVVNTEAITGDPQGSLISVTEKNAHEIGWGKNGDLDLGDLDLYKRGVYTIVFNEKGEMISGSYPADVHIDLPFREDQIRTYVDDGTEFYVYDIHSSLGLWLRGVISSEEASHLMHVFIVLLWALVPGLIVLSVGGGWLIAWTAFRPMEKIIAAANSITDGDDLSKRIGLKRGAREMKRLSRTFDSMFDRLERSFNAEKQFASDASHELRTPIAVITAECDRAHRKNKTVEDYEETICEVEKQTDRMSGLIDQLLSLTRIQLGTERYPLSETDFSEFTASVCEEFVPRERRGITMTTDIDPGISVKCNLSLMSSVIYNLLQNAYKYGREDGHISVTLKAEEHSAVLRVIDDGPGISAENLTKIWDRFWQADASRGTSYGSGLGLSLVKEAVTLHGGTVTAESTEGAGSTFIISLPLISG